VGGTVTVVLVGVLSEATVLFHSRSDTDPTGSASTGVPPAPRTEAAPKPKSAPPATATFQLRYFRTVRLSVPVSVCCSVICLLL
jgi:hypothetical protein